MPVRPFSFPTSLNYKFPGFSRFTGHSDAGLLATVKTLLRPVIAVLLGLSILGGTMSQAATSQPVNTGNSASTTSKPASGSKPPPGVEVAQAISTITGVAISPLLGVGAIGAWKYSKTPPEKRAGLPWFAQPWFWVPALLLVTLVFVKDTAGAALPTALKKPLDVAEVFENKISALVAAGAFVPIIALIAQAAAEADQASYQGTLLAAFNPTSLLSFITVPVAIMAFFVVWMVSHVINVLIIVSPFTTVDAALKSVRLALLSSVTLTSFAHPYVGAAWALIIIAVSYFLAGWSLRLTVFGTVFAWDYVTFHSARTKPDPERNHVFTAKAIEEAPIRSYGRLTREANGRLVLTYRPWLVLPARQQALPEGTYAIGRGLLHPELLKVEGEETHAVITLPPRYNGHEEELNHIYQLAGIQSVGLQAWWDWIKGAFRSKPAIPAQSYPDLSH